MLLLGLVGCKRDECTQSDECAGNTPICSDRDCRACRDDSECGQLICAPDGSCQPCRPGVAGHCNPEGPDSICGDYVCRGCIDNAECAAVYPERPVCLEGNCTVCNSTNHAGCDPRGENPRCVGEACAPCSDDAFCASLPMAPGDYCIGSGRCAACDPADDAGCRGVRPICDEITRICRACRANEECATGRCSAAGACVDCDPNDRSTCVHDGFGEPTGPVCDGPSGRCRACADDAQCDGHAYGPFCVDGLCACRPDGTRCDLGRDRPICHGGECVGCANDTECGSNLYGRRCDRNSGTCVP
ncbi:MAG: hypothetical protein R3F65_24105 [bacterium]